jgi:hypothetical protein
MVTDAYQPDSNWVNAIERHTLCFLLAGLILMSSCTSKTDPVETANIRTVHVYLLAGQSNMDGLGLISELPDAYKAPFEGVLIYNPNRRNDQDSIEDEGFWDALQPGHGSGYGFDSTGHKFSDKFGIELSFARTMREFQPEQAIALFKYAKGGASIHPDAANIYGSWNPDFDRGNGINQWDHFEHHFKRAMSVTDIDGDGVEEKLVPAGILWLQGESDAVYTEEIAMQYGANLANLMSKMRELAGDPQLPIVIARISESMQGPNGVLLTYGDIVRQAQASFAESDPYAAYIDAPDGHGWLDPWHYDSKTYLDLGVSFAKSILTLKTPTNHDDNQ